MVENTVVRLKKFIDIKGISIHSFEKKVGFSNGAFATPLKNNKTIGVDKVENILRIFPDINAEWLLTGDGEMLRHSNIGHTTSGDNSPINGDIEINTCKAALGTANTKIEYLEQRLKDKDEIIELLKKQIK
jgi:hypothetical protein